ncbi:MAG: cyclase family protein [Tenacibaculum sp.]
MEAVIHHHKQRYFVNLSKPIDISIAINTYRQNVNAWYVDKPSISPVILGQWTGSVDKGAPVNFNEISFKPHAHITHTECVGHITNEFYSINNNLLEYFFLAELISVSPKEMKSGDFIISKKMLSEQIKANNLDAIVIRTLPNSDKKKSAQYSNTNPPYMLEESADYLKSLEIKHLLIDLPSIDKEKDSGKLLAHRAFWNTKGKIRNYASITEFIYVPNWVKDGVYLLNLMIAPFENNATPSKPVLYKAISQS